MQTIERKLPKNNRAVYCMGSTNGGDEADEQSHE